MSNSDDRYTGSINLTLHNINSDPVDQQSSLTSPLLSEYEVVPNHVLTKHSEEPEKSSDHTSSGSSELSSYPLSSIGTVHLDAELSTARKLQDVCNEFQEAAIYLKEGVENEKLWHHPTDAKSYWAYMVIHHPVYYISEFLTCVLLLLLAFLEKPTFIAVPVQVAPSLELLFLFYISIDVVLKLLWIRPKFAFKHRRTVFKCILLVVMFVEAITVLARGNNHIRVTRALRPLFLLDTILLQDVRRILRQIFQCLGPIFDVLILLFFFVTIFAVSGFYLFGSNSSTNFQFSSFRESFISMYILTTTANFPDVMMESYSHGSLAPIFFIIFLIIGLYIIANVLLAVVYSTFQKIQKEKFRKLFLHRRDAMRHAFSVLAVKGPKHRVLPLQSYLRLMEYYSPFTSKLTNICTFKAMSKEVIMIDEEEAVGLDEFQQFYDIQGLSWSRVTGFGEIVRWYNNRRIQRIPDFVYNALKHLTQAVESLYFKATMNLIVLSNALFFFIITSHVEDYADQDKRFDKSQAALAINFVYVGIYLLEIIIKLFAFGPVHYFRSHWNVFDFAVTTITFVIQLFEIRTPFLTFVIPLRFLRLIRFNKRFRTIVNTLAILLPRIISIIVLLILIYYFFAIIGMEAFSGKVHPNCCNDSHNDIGMYYTGNGSDVYYLNNFDSISQSFVTLFELMVVNNWWIIMEGFHNAVGNKPSRAFFICFHLSTAVVLTVAIAFIVEAFVHKYHLAQFTTEKDKPKPNKKFLIKYEVEVKEDEIQMIEENFKRAYWPWELPKAYRKQMNAAVSLKFEGIKRRTKEDLHKLLFEDCIEGWIGEDKRFQKSKSYKYNQKPETPSTALIKRFKNGVIYSLLYIFD